MPVAKFDHSRAELLAVVERSPTAAGAHDRAGWVGLFTADGTVEDPVGSRPHCGPAALGRFYDTFIGPRDIVFHRDTELVMGSTVIRDLELEVTMASSLVMRIPAYLRYDVDSDGDQLKIARLGTSDLVSRLAGASWRKVIASGGSVAATIERGSQRSVLIAELSRPTEISRIRIFADD